MKLFSIILVCLSLLGACEGGGSPEELLPDGGGALKSDGGSTSSIPTTPFPYGSSKLADYTISGVTAYLGANPCANGVSASSCAAGQGGCAGWEPGLELCWPATEEGGRGGVCGVKLGGCSGYPAGSCSSSLPACGTYPAGTLRIWSMGDVTVDAATGAYDVAQGIPIPSTAPQYLYKGDPASFGNAGTGGYICLPNAAPYTIPCS